MKFQTLAAAALFTVAAVVAPVTVSAAECTTTQADAIDKYDYTEMQKVCPVLFDEAANIADPTRPDTFTPESLATMSSCKDKACIAELSKLVAATPDCTVGGLSINGVYSATVKLCEGFNAGNVTVAKAGDIFKDVSTNATLAMETDEESGGSGSSAGAMKATVTPPTPPTSVETTPAASTASPSSTPASSTPKPSTAPKSAANVATVAGLAVVATTSFVLSFLC